MEYGLAVVNGDIRPMQNIQESRRDEIPGVFASKSAPTEHCISNRYCSQSLESTSDNLVSPYAYMSVSMSSRKALL